MQILQRVWWRLDRALDDESDPARRRSVGGADALLAGTTTVVDHHASPNAIDGSLDMVAAALERARRRSVLCYEVTDRDGPERAAAGSRRIAGSPSARHGRSPPRAGRRTRVVHALRRDPRELRASSPNELGTGIHVHVAEDAADERDAQARFGRRVVERLADAGALDGSIRCSRTASTSTSARSSLIHAAGRLGRAQRPLEHEQPRRPARRWPRSATARHARDRRDRRRPVRRVAGGVLARSRGRPVRRRRSGRSRGSRRPARLAGGRVRASRSSDGSSPGRPPTSSCSTTTRRPRSRRRTSPATGCSGSSARDVRDVLVAGEFVVRDRRLTRTDDRRAARALARGRRTSVAPDGRDRRTSLHAGGRQLTGGREVRRPRRAVPPGRAPDPRRDRATCSTPRSAGSRPCGRRRAGSCARRPSRWPRSPRRPSGSRSAPASSTAGRATSACWPPPSRRSTTSRRAACMLGIGAWWEPLATKVGDQARTAARGDARDVEAVRRLIAMENVTFHGEFVDVDDIEIDIVHGDRSPRDVPIYIGATGMKMMELAGEIADGVLLNYLVSPALQRVGDGAPRGRRRAGRPHRRGHRPPAARRVLARRGPGCGARPCPRARHAVPGPAAAHREGERRRPVAARRHRQGAHVARHPGGDPQGDGSGTRRGRADDHRVRHSRTNAARRCASTSTPDARAPSCTRSATTSGR